MNWKRTKTATETLKQEMHILINNFNRQDQCVAYYCGLCKQRRVMTSNGKQVF